MSSEAAPGRGILHIPMGRRDMLILVGATAAGGTAVWAKQQYLDPLLASFSSERPVTPEAVAARVDSAYRKWGGKRIDAEDRENSKDRVALAQCMDLIFAQVDEYGHDRSTVRTASARDVHEIADPNVWEKRRYTSGMNVLKGTLMCEDRGVDGHISIATGNKRSKEIKDKDGKIIKTVYYYEVIDQNNPTRNPKAPVQINEIPDTYLMGTLWPKVLRDPITFPKGSPYEIIVVEEVFTPSNKPISTPAEATPTSNLSTQEQIDNMLKELPSDPEAAANVLALHTWLSLLNKTQALYGSEKLTTQIANFPQFSSQIQAILAGESSDPALPLIVRFSESYPREYFKIIGELRIHNIRFMDVPDTAKSVYPAGVFPRGLLFNLEFHGYAYDAYNHTFATRSEEEKFLNDFNPHGEYPSWSSPHSAYIYFEIQGPQDPSSIKFNDHLSPGHVEVLNKTPKRILYPYSFNDWEKFGSLYQARYEPVYVPGITPGSGRGPRRWEEGFEEIEV